MLSMSQHTIVPSASVRFGFEPLQPRMAWCAHGLSKTFSHIHGPRPSRQFKAASVLGRNAFAALEPLHSAGRVYKICTGLAGEVTVVAEGAVLRSPKHERSSYALGDIQNLAIFP